MIRPGVVSVTFRWLSPSEVLALAAEASLETIEWSGDWHVPRGQPSHAQDLAARTAAAGLTVAGFGSYYRLCSSEDEGYAFETALRDGEALGAPAIRVWAGTRGSADADKDYRRAVAGKARALGDGAAKKGIRVVFEYHDGTLTDTDESALQLLHEVDHPNVGILWQPHNGVDPAVNVAGLRSLLPWVYYVHVFHWWPTHEHRHPLEAGTGPWHTYLDTLAETGRDTCALLEFVAGDEPDAFRRDADVLRAWCHD